MRESKAIYANGFEAMPGDVVAQDIESDEPQLHIVNRVRPQDGHISFAYDMSFHRNCWVKADDFNLEFRQ